MRLAILVPVKPVSSYANEVRELLKPYIQGVELEIEFLERGLEQIETAYDDAVTAPLVAEKVRELWRRGFDGVLINCFDDPGLEASREIVPIPVLGAGYAAMIGALLLGDRFSIITVGGSESLRVVRKRVEYYGLCSKLVSVYSLGMHVVDIDRDRDRALSETIKLSRKALNEDGADVVVLGCTGLSPLYPSIARELGYHRVVDPTIWGFLLLKTLVVLHRSLKELPQVETHGSTHI